MRSILLTLLLAPAVVGAQADTLAYSRLKYRYIGPEGNRISTVTGVIGNPNVIYAGAASGGIFKSTDGGIHWAPIFDSQPVASIGALMVAPSDPNVVWAGTGEPFIRSHISLGWGAFKSLDAGKTWTRMGLENTGRIARVVIDPRDPDRVYVAALGAASEVSDIPLASNKPAWMLKCDQSKPKFLSAPAVLVPNCEGSG
jgi:hypothetical protein